MMFLVGSSVVREDHSLARLLAWRPIARIGVVSYGIYLLHLSVLIAVGAPGWELADLPRFLITAIGSILVAELSYRYYETPFLKWKGRFAVPRWPRRVRQDPGG